MKPGDTIVGLLSAEDKRHRRRMAAIRMQGFIMGACAASVAMAPFIYVAYRIITRN